MSIKQKLGLMIGMPLAGLLILIAGYVYTDSRLERHYQHWQLGKEIILGASELQYLTADFLTFRDQQAAARWREAHASLGRHLASVPRHPAAVEAVDRTRLAYAVLGESFAALTRGQTGPENVVERIIEASAGMVIGAAQLANSSAAEVEKLRESARHGYVLIGLMLAAMSALVMLFFGRDLMRVIDSPHGGVARTGDRGRRGADPAHACDGTADDLEREIARREDSERRLAAAQRSLKDQVDELARSNAEFEQFTYIASHDLQEPLRTISSYAQLLESRYRDKLDDGGTDFIDFIVDGASRMQRLITDLLAFSRAVRGGGELEPVPLDQVVDAAVKNLGPLMRDTSATLQRESLPTVHGDAGQLTQVFENLLSNALKFRGEASPVVRIAALSEDSRWQIRVSDNGIGIDMCHEQRIFEPFRRLHAGGQYPGSGLGLALCRKLIARHGGRIWLEAQAEGGSCFCFTVNAAGSQAPIVEHAA